MHITFHRKRMPGDTEITPTFAELHTDDPENDVEFENLKEAIFFMAMGETQEIAYDLRKEG